MTARPRSIGDAPGPASRPERPRSPPAGRADPGGLVNALPRERRRGPAHRAWSAPPARSQRRRWSEKRSFDDEAFWRRASQEMAFHPLRPLLSGHRPSRWRHRPGHSPDRAGGIVIGRELAHHVTDCPGSADGRAEGLAGKETGHLLHRDIGRQAGSDARRGAKPRPTARRHACPLRSRGPRPTGDRCCRRPRRGRGRRVSARVRLSHRHISTGDAPGGPGAPALSSR
ncbi:unnamed protein product [Acanthosepion pharaonis]|uniref:Uncharacterized protein n=1 Tax=Acanthosepion pharaonis TaxID=158019 RepID=A0A812DLE2_ACAPH|nr:unnamed protein product [Sepia pharaonis]